MEKDKLGKDVYKGFMLRRIVGTAKDLGVSPTIIRRINNIALSREDELVEIERTAWESAHQIALTGDVVSQYLNARRAGAQNPEERFKQLGVDALMAAIPQIKALLTEGASDLPPYVHAEICAALDRMFPEDDTGDRQGENKGKKKRR